jgi:hypothetical protein
MLHLETRNDETLVVDAPVVVRANADDSTLACLQAYLKGRTFPSPGTAPGTRSRVPLSIQP